MNQTLPASLHHPAVVLTTLNAKYIHASLGLRYLLSNMARHGGADLRETARLREFTISSRLPEVAAELLDEFGEPDSTSPQILGLGVYIWNVSQTTELVRLLKQLRPSLVIVLGGPEVSYESETQTIVELSDYLITGWGDVSFPKLCCELLAGNKPPGKIIVGEQPALTELAAPYADYTADDLAHRLLYVEASRGCPFKCEFCLSSLDKTAWAFPLEPFLAELDTLYQRGARNFKFVDRTFNLKIDASIRILNFFLDRLDDAQGELFVHFEVIPDHLPDKLKAVIALFPEGVLQFEVGVQSFNEEVQRRISRQQNNPRTEANIRWLVEHSQAHLHTDLIFGLPGESLASFAEGFDRLYALKPHEIQLGVLKRLRGTPITRHTAEFGMVYDEQAPYVIQATGAADAETVRGFIRLARYWDLIANSGRFKLSLPVLLSTRSDGSAFWAFWDFANWLWQSTQKTHGLSPENLVDALFGYLTETQELPPEPIRQSLLADYQASGARAKPECLRGLFSTRGKPLTLRKQGLSTRQGRHIIN